MKTPKIRFKRFEGAWEEDFLGNNATITTWKLDANAAKADWEYAFFTCWKETLKTDSYIFDWNAILISWNWDVWYTRRYSWKFNAYQRTYVLQNFLTNFSYTEYAIHNWLPKRIQCESFWWAMPYIKLNTLSKLHISLPSLPEQEKIWSLFEQLDSLISKNQQKLEKLKNMKQSFLQKLFPKDWSALPELRFKGFEEAWEERKLGEICQITMWQSPDWSTYSNKKSDYILVQWNSDLKNWRVVPRIRTTQKTKTANVGDLIMSVRAPAWAIWKTGYDIVLWRWVASIKGNDFVFYSLVKLDTFWYWKRLSAWSTFDSINSDSIQNLNIYFPSLPEQKKIWAFFEKLDTQIIQQTQKIQKLQNLKQSLLEKMFI